MTRNSGQQSLFAAIALTLVLAASLSAQVVNGSFEICTCFGQFTKLGSGSTTPDPTLVDELLADSDYSAGPCDGGSEF